MIWRNYVTVTLCISLFPLFTENGKEIENGRSYSACHFYSRTAMLARYMPAVSVYRQKSEFYRNSWTDRAGFLTKGPPSAFHSLLCSTKIWVPSKIRVLFSVTLSQAVNLVDCSGFFRHGTSTVASVVIVVRPTERPPLFTAQGRATRLPQLRRGIFSEDGNNGIMHRTSC